MRYIFVTTGLATVMLLVSADTSNAQVVSITSTGYKAGPPPEALPKGDWSTAKRTVVWRVKWDYGMLVDGKYTVDGTIAGGGSFELPPINPTTGSWEAAAAQELVNPIPGGAAVRAKLQSADGSGGWIDQGSPVIEFLK